METALKHSLLLTHGTIYGDIPAVLPWVDYTAKSASLDQMADQVEWRNGLYYADPVATALHGAMTNNAPIDVYSWAVTGHAGETGLEWWQQCMTLFMRHI